MLGAIIGDIVGSRWEFNPTNDYNFELFSDKNGFTDDTICTVAVADAIVHGSDDYGKFIHKWCRKYPNPMGGYGGRFQRWVMSDNPKPYGSYGNGSAMRVSPVGWMFGLQDGLLDQAKKTAECTHNDPAGITGAQAVAMAVRGCLRMRKEFKGREITPEDIRMNGLYLALGEYTKCPQTFDLDIERYRNKFDETCQGTVPVALWIVMHSTSFEDAIRRAVSLGADADTLGAIVGSIAEALWGIPEWMKQKALSYLPDDMKQVLFAFRDRLWQQRKEKAEQFAQTKAIMFWKLANGNVARILNGENGMPDKSKVATKESWEIKPMPEDSEETSIIKLTLALSHENMKKLRRGHIPEAQEDHWFMYCDGEYIRYYRSWTGMCAFEAHVAYSSVGEAYYVDKVKVNHALVEFGVNGDIPAACLFMYLIAAEVGGDAASAWKDFTKAWEKQALKSL